MSTQAYSLHGLKLSYFTGKLETYLRAKGIAFEYVEMDSADFRACAARTGVAQMPQLGCPDGTWLTDTTPIIAHFEAGDAGPSFRPRTPLARFTSLLLEDAFDEWLWRPALYYRWAFAEDARLMSSQIARTLLRDVPGPHGLRAWFILNRQRRTYLKQDGVTRETAPLIEEQFHLLVRVLETIFSKRSYLMGERPVEADFGLMGPFFRHFSYDPTPASLLREKAPHTLAWVSRMWATGPEAHAAAPLPGDVPDDLGPLLQRIGADYLPYLALNAAAVENRQRFVSYAEKGVRWKLPASPYRRACLGELQRAFAGLTAEERAAALAWLGEGGACLAEAPAGSVTAIPHGPGKPLDRLWQSVLC